MSTLVEFVLPDLSKVEGLRELLTTWAGEEVSFDPARYRYDELVFTRVPIAGHVRSALPVSLRAVEHCLELDEAVVLDWSRGALQPTRERALRAFFDVVSKAQRQWAAVHDPSSGRVQSSYVDASKVFQRLAEAVEGTLRPPGLSVLIAS